MIKSRLVYQNTYMYIIQMENTGQVKIGTARNPWKRLIGLQTASPYKLNMLYFTMATDQDEKDNHELFKKYRLQGEWFLPHPSIFEGIEYLKKWDKRDGWNWKNFNPEYDLNKQNQIILCEETDAWSRYLIKNEEAQNVTI